MSADDVFNLVKADLERAKDEMRQQLEREMFKTDPLFAALPPLKRKPWWLLRYWALRTYGRTLWWALRGEALHRDRECSGDLY